MNAPPASLTAVARSARALASGLLVGVLLTAFFEAAKSALAGPGTLLSWSAAAEASVIFGLYYGVLICVVCVPAWLVLKRLGFASPLTAALLGFVATLVIWQIDNGPALVPLVDGLPYALFGGIAGLTVWWSDGRR